MFERVSLKDWKYFSKEKIILFRNKSHRSGERNKSSSYRARGEPNRWWRKDHSIFVPDRPCLPRLNDIYLSFDGFSCRVWSRDVLFKSCILGPIMYKHDNKLDAQRLGGSIEKSKVRISKRGRWQIIAFWERNTLERSENTREESSLNDENGFGIVVGAARPRTHEWFRWKRKLKPRINYVARLRRPQWVAIKHPSTK